MHFLTRKCCVPECGNASTMGDGCFKTYFEFPSDKALREKWFNAIFLTQEPDMKDVKICDDHFDNNTKFTTQNSIKRLRLGSIPTLKLPKYVCKKCFGTVNEKAKDAKKFCQCEQPDVEKMPKADENVANEKEEKAKKIKKEKEKKEKLEKERLEKERLKKKKDKTDKEQKNVSDGKSANKETNKIKEKKSNDKVKKERQERDKDKENSKRNENKKDESSEKNRKGKTDKSKRDGSRDNENERKASSSKEKRKSDKSRSRRDSVSSSGSSVNKEWSLEEKEALVQLVEKHGKLRKLESGRFRIKWDPVFSRFRQMGYKSHNQKDVLRQWSRILERSRKLHKEHREPNKLEKRVIRFTILKDVPYLYESGSGSGSGESDKDDSDDSDASNKSKRSSKRRAESTSSSSDNESEAERKAARKKAKYGTYTIVNKDDKRGKNKEESYRTNIRRSRSKNMRKSSSSDESYFSEPKKTSKQDRRKNRGSSEESDKDKSKKEIAKSKRKRTIKKDAKSGIKSDIEDNRDDYGGSDRDNVSDVELKKSKVKSEDSSSSDEYMSQDQVAQFLKKEEPEVKIKEEVNPEQQFGIWEVQNSGVKPEPTSDIDQTSSGNEANDSDGNNVSSDESDDDDNQKLGLEDLKKMGINVDDILKTRKIPDPISPISKVEFSDSDTVEYIISESEDDSR